MDTDARCATNVYCYYIEIKTVNQLRQKYVELDQALDKQERFLVDINRKEPAIDYIIQDPYTRRHYYKNVKTGKLIHNYKKEQ